MAWDEDWTILRDDVQQQHTLFDRKIEECIDDYTRKGGHVHCGRGCRGCCNLAVNCSFHEALRIATALTEQQTDKIISHALLILEHIGALQDLKSYLRMHRQRIGFCPLLLDDGSCGVYGMRPFSCRALISTKENRWCSVDFGTLPAAEKAAFVDSLDRTEVSFPTHYLYSTQDLGQQLEARATMAMAARFGFSLSGNLPFLIYLEIKHQLSRIIPRGHETTIRFLAEMGLLHPFLIVTEAI